MSTQKKTTQSSIQKKENVKLQILPTSLCNYESFDLPTDLEIDLWNNWKEFQLLIKNASTQSDRVNILQRTVSLNMEQHKKIVSAIVFGMLLQTIEKDQLSLQVLFNDLSSIIRDHYDCVIKVLYVLIEQCYDYFKESTLKQLFQLCELLIQKAIPSLKDIFLLLLRQIIPNTNDQKSLNLNKQLVDLFQKYRDWVIQQPQLVSVVFFKFLRQAEEHFKTELLELREQELRLCLSIWQAKKDECFEIGKEFMRIVINLSKLKQLNPIFEDLRQEIDGKALFNHLQKRQGYKQGQKNFYLQALIPIKVELQLEFMLTKIPQESYSIYLKWFLDGIQMEYGTESESFLVDIVRHIVVNINPSNDIIKSKILQRYVLIGNFIRSQKHLIHQSLVLQSLFIDWLFYDDTIPNQIMLVEPGMLLMYRSVDKYPEITEKLIEFLDIYVKNHDSSRSDEFAISVQRVLIDCEKKNVIQSIRNLINHPRLNPDIQSKLKYYYRADQIIKEQNSKQNQSTTLNFDSTYYNQMNDPYQQSRLSDYDQIPMDIEFSPTHEEMDKQENEAIQYEQEDSDQQRRMNEHFNENGENNIQQSSDHEMRQQEQYNIDLFQSEVEVTQEESKEIQQDQEQSDQQYSSSQTSSSQSSSDSEESSDREDRQDKRIKTQIQIPQQILQKCLTKNILDKYLENTTQENLKLLLDDLCSNIIKQKSEEIEFTELAFIIYESLKHELSKSDISQMIRKWDSYTFVGLFTYLIANSTAQKTKEFAIISQIVSSLTHFDKLIETKLLLHIIFNFMKQKKYKKVYIDIILKYIKFKSNDKTKNQNLSDIQLTTEFKIMVQNNLSLLVSHVQLKVLNHFFLSNLPEMMNEVVTDNDQFLKILVKYGYPEIISKIVFGIQTNRYQLISQSVMQMIQIIFYDNKLLPYICQQHIWQIINSHDIKMQVCLLRSLYIVQVQELRQLIQSSGFCIENKFKQVKALTATFIGFSNFSRQYLQISEEKERQNVLSVLNDFQSEFSDCQDIKKELQQIYDSCNNVLKQL